MRIYITEDQRAARLKEMDDFARRRGGRCLSLRYENKSAKLEFWCLKHGAFHAQPHNIKHREQWCPKCPPEQLKQATLLHLIDYVKFRGGTLLSEYVNARTHVIVRCPIHGEWKATPDNLVNKRSWCLHCARAKPRPGRRRKSSHTGPLFV